MTQLQEQLYEAIMRTKKAIAANDPDWIHHDRERSRLLRLRQDEMWNERKNPPVHFERTPDEGLL